MKNHTSFHFRDDSTLANQGAGKTIEKPLKELPWYQQTDDRNFLILLYFTSDEPFIMIWSISLTELASGYRV